MAAFTLAPLVSGTVIGRFGGEVGDGADAGTAPDGVPATGTITFTAGPTAFLVVAGNPAPVTIFPQPVTTVLDADGYLTYNGVQGVELQATDDPAINPSLWTWTASFNLSVAGTKQNYPAFPFALPAGTVVNLTGAAPVPASTGNAIVTGPGVAAGGTTGQILSKASNGNFDTTWITNTGGGGGGGVTSVNALTGTVTLTQDTIPDGTNAKQYTNAEKAKVAAAAPVASPTFTGIPAAPTATPGTNTTQVSTTAFVTGGIATEAARATTAEGLKANIASPTFTGTPAAPTATVGTNSTQLATTAFVAAAVVSSSRPAVMYPVKWNSGTGTWQYKGVTATAIPAEAGTYDTPHFIGNPGGTLPAWAPNDSPWTQG